MDNLSRYTPEYLRLLISAAGGPAKVVLLGIRNGIKVTESHVSILQNRGLPLKQPRRATITLIQLLEVQYGDAIKVPPTHEELQDLIRHFGGLSGVLEHIEQYHPNIHLNRCQVQYMAQRTTPDYPLYPLAVQVCLALREGKDRFKAFEGHYRGNRFQASLRGRFPSLDI